MNNFQILERIGEGSFSVVYRARRNTDGQHYAIKKIKLASMTNQDRSHCLHQILYLANITHPNIIQYKQAFYEHNHLYLVTEYAQKGSLLDYMIARKKKRSPFTEEQVCKLALEMVSGIDALHRTKIIHRDIKPANYFMMADEQLKLGDLNVSAISRTRMAFTKIGTPCYTSPEIWKELPYSFESDIWSLGCILYEIITFQRAFTGLTIPELKSNILNACYSPLPESCPQKLRQIIEGCLKKQPKDRYTASELMNNAYLRQSYKKYKLESMKKVQVNDKQYRMNCMRILRQIKNEDSSDRNKLRFPPSQYKSNNKIPQGQSNASTKRGKKSCSKQMNSRLTTMYAVYNQKPPPLNKIQHTLNPRLMMR